ncbi:MAG: sulfite exporter TauE/SafE family protein [Candidatus Omnitrophica bacterium]|nr:sulfite exporter TauE/SafE family protein [Candidatus Omnitrophota bacterium]
MNENLFYLFASGLILGWGPCMGFCGPVLLTFFTSSSSGAKSSLKSYAVFSSFKLIGYMVLGFIFAGGSMIIRSLLTEKFYSNVYTSLGVFIILIGLAVIFSSFKKTDKACQCLLKGNIRNTGVMGLLVGFSPCLPLLGILDYIVLISRNPFDGIIFALVFGLGTVLSPFILFVLLSGKASKWLEHTKGLRSKVNIIFGIILIYLGLRITGR